MTGDDPLRVLRESVLRGDRAAADSFLRSRRDAIEANPKLANSAGLLVLPIAPERAAALFEAAVRRDPAGIPLWLNLAAAHRATDDRNRELEALEKALSLDPYQPAALASKAFALEALGDIAASARVFAALLSAYPPRPGMPEALRGAIEYGEALIARVKDQLAQTLSSDVAAALAAVDPAARERASLFTDIFFGRKKAYLPQPTGAYYPQLPAVEFFARDMFPWFAELEAGTARIAAELSKLLESRTVAAQPYVRFSPSEPVNQWAELNHSEDWSAFFLKKDGTDQDRERALCPFTAALIDRLPLMDMPGKAPTVLFSLLKPRTRIPAHTGSTNVRATVHLPLIVPPDCGFRVGSTVREWRYGEAWAFDDTIEHEAWNDSGQLRAVLILDAWNPYLSEGERQVARAARV